MSLWHVAFGSNDSWVHVTTSNISWSLNSSTSAYNLLHGRYNNGQNNSPIRVFDMDENDGYFAVYKNNGFKYSFYGNPDTKYFGKIKCVALGPDNSFVIIGDRIQWKNVPHRVGELIRTKSNSSVKWVALGCHDAFFVSFNDGRCFWGGTMQSTLLSELQNGKKNIRKLFLSASSAIWCILFEDGSIKWSGNAPISFSNSMKKHKYMSPNDIAYSNSSIKSEFICGRSIQETVEMLQSKRTNVEDIPCITVVEHQGITWSLNNRRLRAFKESGVDSIPVIVGEANTAFKQRLHNRLYNDIHIR
eukprot:58931_1